jgi:cytochrome c-type biogenesis protein CcmE
MNDLDPFQGDSISDEWKQQDAPRDLEARKNRKPILILGLVALAAIFAMSLNVLGKSTVYYKTPTEVLTQPNETVRVSGTVVPGSIEYDSANGVVTFEITDENDTVMTVDYSGTAPDTLKDNAQAVAEGEYVESDEVFEATTLFAKCPSKFSAKTPGAEGM